MTSLQPALATLLSSIPPRPVDQEKLKKLVKDTVQKTTRGAPGVKVPSNEIRKSQWEYVLRNDIFNLAVMEGQALKDPQTKFYDEMCGKLDVILAFTELDAVDQTFPFSILQDLFETFTIPSCSHIFTYLESRSSRLTTGMIPQKGKALVLLRTLNDLLRRLSKTGSRTILCGRILNFLSGVFPLGERSGVNLRGEYGPVWERVKHPREQEEDTEMKDVTPTDAMDVDSPAKTKAPDPKADFYNTFWSLQLPFSKPPIFANPDTFPQFKEAVNKILPVIKEATAKDRAMMGSRSVNGPAPTFSSSSQITSAKRKRDGEETEESNLADYFFAKFLTSPDLLELEIADTHFRRQFLLQLLILLNHLLNFTPDAKATWCTPRNRSLQMDFALDPETDVVWVKEMVNKTTEEMKATTPNGRVFAEMVGVVVERERNWVRWKNEMCVAFDKEPAYVEIDCDEAGGGEKKKRKVGLLEATREERKKLLETPLEEYKYKYGTVALTESWLSGCSGLHALEDPRGQGEVKDFIKQLDIQDSNINRRRQQLVELAQVKTKAEAKAKVAQEKAQAEAEAATATVPQIKVQAPAEGTSPNAPEGQPEIAQPTPLHPSLPAKPGSTSVSTAAATATTTTLDSSAAPAQASSVPSPATTPAPASKLPSDPVIDRLEENKSRISWVALRATREQHWKHFGKIGTGDVVLLQKEIEKEDREEREKSERAAKGEAAEGEGEAEVMQAEGEAEGTQMEGEDGEKEDGGDENINGKASEAQKTETTEGGEGVAVEPMVVESSVDSDDVKMDST